MLRSSGDRLLECHRVPGMAVGRDRWARTDGHPEPDESPRITSRQHWPTHDPEDFLSTRLYRSPPCSAALSGKATVTAAGTPGCTGRLKVVPTFVMRGSSVRLLFPAPLN